jgi:hypothetical protein
MISWWYHIIGISHVISYAISYTISHLNAISHAI